MRPLALVFVSLSLILCLISTTTNYWYERHEDGYNSGLFVECSRFSLVSEYRICHRLPYMHSRGLSISSFIFLSFSFIILILSWFKSSNILLSYLTVLFLLISSFLLMFSYIFYPRRKDEHYFKLSHSSYLMLVSSLLAFSSTILTTITTQTISSN